MATTRASGAGRWSSTTTPEDRCRDFRRPLRRGNRTDTIARHRAAMTIVKLLRTLALLMSGYAATGTAMVLLSRHVAASRRTVPAGLPPYPPYPPHPPAR